jgi:Rps23 Pro-64 3,4-dihydroxylase Tpa1-like proline 4-hydroxylase
LLHVANESGFQCYVPGWGDLVLLELGESGENHFVSEVTSMAPRPRIAISGWYNEGDTDA